MNDLDKLAQKVTQDAKRKPQATTLATPPPLYVLGASPCPSTSIYARGPGFVSHPTVRPGVSFLEKDEQRSFILWLRQMGLRHHSIPNSAARSETQCGDLKREGLMPGVPDLYVFLPGKASLAIEMKRESGRLSDVDGLQWDWHGFLPSVPGWFSCVAFGKKAAVAFVQAVARYLDEGVPIIT